MEFQKPKIELYVKRSFGDKLNASFDFIKENWKILLRYTTYLILPLCLIQGLSLNGLMSGIMTMGVREASIGSSETDTLIRFFTYYGLYAFLYLIGTVLLTSLVYALMRVYKEREQRLEGVSLTFLKPLLIRNVRKLFIVFLFGFLILAFVGLVVGLLGFILPFSVFLVILLLIVFIVPLALWAPVYVFEEISVIDALKKSYHLGFPTWGGILLISLVMGFIAGTLQSITMMPWYIASMVKVFFSVSGENSEFLTSAGYSFILYLMAILQAFGAYLALIFSLVGIAYQYGHASEKVDHITVENDIDNFDKL